MVNQTRQPVMSCPHCRSKAITRGSEEQTSLSRELRYRCSNDGCGHIFVAQLAILYSVVPSLVPDPAVKLRLSTFHRPANDRAPAPANDVTAQAIAT